ncbi:MAG: PAS domain S-box protein [Methanobacteriota archaeon]
MAFLNSMDSQEYSLDKPDRHTSMISILYVDDEEALLYAVKLTLEDTGRCSVDTASSPELALVMLSSHPYDAIISDYDMPDMKGVEFLQMVRARFGDIPFIFYTGVSKEDVLIEAINNGANYYLQKGGDPEPQFAELIHSVEQAVFRRRAEQALHESETRYRNIIENIIDVYYRTDHEGKLIFASPSCLTLLGYDSMNEVLNRLNDSFWKFPEERSQMLAILRKNGQVHDYEVTLLKKCGKDIDVAVSTRFYTNENGDIAGVEGIFRDISERKQAASALQVSEERYRQFVEHFHGIAYQIEYPGYTPRIFQGDVATITGFPEIEFSSGTVCWIDLIHPDDKKMVLIEGQCLIDDPDRIGTTEYRIRHRDGQWRWISDTSQSVAAVFNHPGLIQGTIQDITARREAEEELKNLNENLNATNKELIATEEQLQERNLELIEQQQILNKSHNALRNANRQLNLLSGITRHDILNKITVMNGYLTLAKDEITNPDIREYIDKLESVTNDIEGQIDFTRIYQDLGTHEPYWIPVSPLISTINVPVMIEFKANINHIEIYADPICGKVFENLLDNTMRHGQKVTKVQISYELTSAGMKIIWEDDGVGVLASEKEAIFERGFGKNTGLGLFLVREILSITGLTISETGPEGEGARFEILIPDGKYHIREEERDDAE